MDLEELTERLLERNEGRELLTWLRLHSAWRTVSAELIVQEGQTQTLSKIIVDRDAQSWSITDGNRTTVASFQDGLMWTAADGEVGKRGETEFENGPSVAFDMIFPWRMHSWGRDRIDDFVPLLVQEREKDFVVVAAHRLEATMTKGISVDKEHAIAMRITEFEGAAVLSIFSIT